MTSEAIAKSWKGKFHFIRETKDKPGLRAPQIGALHALLARQDEEGDRSIVVMPTGTGKTETMLSFMIANQCEKLMVVVPFDALRTQTYNKFVTLGKLIELGVVDKNIKLPKVKKIDKMPTKEEWGEILKTNNVIVTTMTMASSITPVVLSELHKEISYLIVDEAHHSEAKTWNDFISGFDSNKVIMFTATPFRDDGKRLKGDVIFNYSLKKAKENHYFSDIDFLPVYAYSTGESDKAIADKAIERLTEDISNGFDHILMARCNNIKRAKEVFEIYNNYPEYSPVLIYNTITEKNKIIEEIKQRKHQIIVCVNMLGEGFDLPQLKIAALHDTRQSLAVTLQLIGRFTRTSGNKIGKASFIANIEDENMSAEIAQLYQEDADWNILLPRISDKVMRQEKELRCIHNDFTGDLVGKVDMGDITPASSTIIYEVETTTSNFKNWNNNLSTLKNYARIYTSMSSDTFVAVMNRYDQVDWSNVRNFYNSSWEIIVIYFNAFTRRVFYNSSSGINPDKIIKNIFGSTFTLVKGERIFKVLKYINRLVLYNVGTKVPNGRDVSFRSFSGSSVEEGIGELEEKGLARNNFFGSGYRQGEIASIGCSFKGKIWSRLRLNISDFKDWCNAVSQYVFNPKIQVDDIFGKMMIRKEVDQIPTGSRPLAADWNEEIYVRNSFSILSPLVMPLEYFELSVGNDLNSHDGTLTLLISNDKQVWHVKYSIGANGPQYECQQTLILSDGKEELPVGKFLEKYPPSIYYSDESELQGSWYTAPKSVESIIIDDKDIIDMDWDGISLDNESMGKEQKKDTIQYYFWKQIDPNFQIVFNDDGSGEIADLIGINEEENEIKIHLFHLKYAKGGKISQRIDNINEVCAQAMKSVKWKHLGNHFNFFRKLLKREALWQKDGKSRILKGSEEDLQRLESVAKYSKKLQFDISVVQPGISKRTMTKDMKQILGSTSHYLFTSANAKFTVYCNKCK